MDDDELLSSTELAEKYAGLLQPARDLAENWGIDLDHLVQDFIQEVASQISQSEDRYNFAEAAILLQGGANCYSKKVDFVYQLALGFFDSLAHKKGKGKNTGAEDAHDAGEDDEPADLMDPCTLPNFAKYKPPKASRWAGAYPVLQERLPQIPMALQPMGAFEKRNVPIVGRNRKEILGKIDELRLYSCMFFKAFCILMKKFLPYTSQTTLPPKRVRFAKQLENKENHAPGSDSYNGSFDDNDFDGGDFGDITPLAEFPDMEQGPPPDAMSTPRQSLEAARASRGSIARQSAGALLRANQLASDAPQAEFEYDETMPGEPPDENGVEEEEEEPVWVPDEYDGNEAEDEDGSWPEVRALRPKKCSRDAREAIKQRTKKLEKDRKEKMVQRREVIKDYIHATIFRHTVRKRGVRFAQFQAYLCDNAVLALSNMVHEESERRRQLEKELRRRAQEEQRQSRSRSRTARLSNRNAQAPAAVVRESEEVVFEGIRSEFDGADDYDDGGFDGFDDDELGIQVEVDDGPEPIGDVDLDLSPVNFSEDEIIVAGASDIFDGYSGAQRSRRGGGHSLIQEREAFDYDSIDINMNSADLDYADQVRLYVKRYWTDGERLSSEMSARVQTWEQKMTSEIKKEDRHEEFRVHDCGSEIIDEFPDVGEKISFKKVLKRTKGEKAYKKSRLFLSALMLTNTGNVEIAPHQPEEEADQDFDAETIFRESDQGKKHSAFSVKLITKERHHERFDDDQQHITGDTSNEI